MNFEPVLVHLRALPAWSGLKLAAVTFAWIILSGVSMIAASLVWVSIRASQLESSGPAGIGAASVGLSTSFMGFVIFAPPVVLTIAWLMKRAPASPEVR